uniref:GDT1 family protein n=1 Tax=Vitrella brassicaformis TaxID=1169539 RepID=A0A7S1P525_9ALVE|mmetsp:Transcript_33267/g.82369  ORF Transcript_33267/g.82369 Transcript_33267/m.82369 type:complete len:254 (+) Transcript_33267:56-817(+)
MSTMLSFADFTASTIVSLSMTVSSEIGDKTFFIAMLLAREMSQLMVFCGTMAALVVMTVISVVMGAAVRTIPQLFHVASVWVGYLSALLFVVFGLQELYVAVRRPEHQQESLKEAEETIELLHTPTTHTSASAAAMRLYALFCMAFGVIFLAEWGDKSMISTVALAATYNAGGVAVGAVIGHALATVLAVVMGALVQKALSQRTMSFIAGVLFLLFAALTFWDTYTSRQSRVEEMLLVWMTSGRRREGDVGFT